MTEQKKEITRLFTNTYLKDLWHMGNGESRSGLGSSLNFTINFRRELLHIIKSYNVKNIFDCSCGDWNWMKTISNHLPFYVGNDVVLELIEENNIKYGNEKTIFVCNDMLSQLKAYKDKEFDLIICRHTLEHLTTEYSLDVLVEIMRVSKYSLITSSTKFNDENSNLDMDGYKARMVNLNKEPYLSYVGEPIYKFFDTEGNEKKEVMGFPNGCFGYLYKF
jgi:ubiquinone/menaquinone biosynthesis C-methylase UbiE